MAGGTWTSQNKVLPGVYINVRSVGNISPSVGDRGVVAIAKALSFGKTGTVIEITPGEDLTPIIGYDITANEAMFIREMTKGSDTTSGPTKILLYRLPGTGGVAAAATIGDLTVTATSVGTRGNDITILIDQDVDTAEYEVQTILDGRVMDSQTVATAADLAANSWIKFSGSTITATAGTALTGGVDPVVSSADYASHLTVIEPYKFDVLIYDGDEETVKDSVAAFIKRLSENTGIKSQCVMANAEGRNSEYVISVNNGVVLSDGTELNANQATWWVGGTEAGANYNQSLTYAQYPGAVSANPKISETDAKAAVSAGKLIFTDSFDMVKVVTDINSLTSFTTDKQQAFSKNRVIRTIHTFCNDLLEQFSRYYIGKTDNNAEGRDLLKGWIVGYLNEMQANSGIQNFTAEDVTVEAGGAIDAVYITAAIQPVDSIEKIYVDVSVSTTDE